MECFGFKMASKPKQNSNFSVSEEKCTWEDGRMKITVNARSVDDPDCEQELSYTEKKKIGSGSFGTVFKVRLQDNELAAIKKVFEDKRRVSHELEILRVLDHCNVVKLKYFFYTCNNTDDKIYLNCVLEFVPSTLSEIIEKYSKSGATISIFLVKLLMYQLFRGLGYIHSLQICHRDIKPQNILVDPESGVLKICDLGIAKKMVSGKPNIPRVGSLFYRAPEQLLRENDYTTKIDVWSAGCVFVELFLKKPIFHGYNAETQLVEIVNVLGMPMREQLRQMKRHKIWNKLEVLAPNHAYPWEIVFGDSISPEVKDLVPKLLEYVPSVRITPLQACSHSFFDELRTPGMRLSNATELPQLFNFTEHELQIEPSLNDILIPPHLCNSRGIPDMSLTTSVAKHTNSSSNMAPFTSEDAESGLSLALCTLEDNDCMTPFTP